MQFEYDEVASMIINATLGTMEPGERMVVYVAHAGTWSFMINYDEKNDQWTASYRTANAYVKKGVKYSAQSCEPPLAITGKRYRYYKTREEAAAAALRKFNQLNN